MSSTTFPISSEAIRACLRGVHRHRAWLHPSGEVNRPVLKSDMAFVLLHTIPQFSITPAWDALLDNVVQDICDVVSDLQGVDNTNPSFYAQDLVVYMSDTTIELFLDMHVGTKLIRAILSHHHHH